MAYSPYGQGGEFQGPGQSMGGGGKPKAPPPPGVNEGLPQGSWGGFNFTSTPTGGSGVGPGMSGPEGIGSEAQFVLQGSAGAEAALRRGYEMMLREQAGNVANAQLEDERKTRASLAAGGVSPLLASLISGSRRTRAQGDYGGAVAGAGADYQMNMANLLKGTGSELAGIKQFDLGLLLKAKQGKDAANAAEQGGLGQVLGGIAGAAGLAGGLGWQPFAK